MSEDQPRVLIADDDNLVRMLLEDICVAHGWNVVSAASAADAILAAGLQRIDLILLDFHLDDSETDPLAALRALRAISPSTPIVVVTGHSPESVAASVTQAGAQGVVGKPCSIAAIAALLRHYRRPLANLGVSR